MYNGNCLNRSNVLWPVKLYSLIHISIQIRYNTYARNFQLGVVISEEGKPSYLCSRKMTGPKKKYTVTGEELIIIVKTLKEFIIILILKDRNYTEHKILHLNFEL